ncbi:hypothetical protein MSAN_02276300 [Mycena sanguinolenta]|uniref:Uncharacterized protein n=1 Tax=Mycena sanguinolenta TaxID=230812 RepID=A0A8H6XA21_9AGAR|nr:hypothetical protein MSAN_02276300 [Mycena sanguinolenta]
MDLHPNFDPQVIVLSTSDNADVAEPTQYPGVVSSEASRRAGTANPFTKSFRFSPPLLSGSFKTSGTSGTHTRKCSETNGRQTAEHLVNNYYYITGGRGGSGGWGGDQGGDGGAGHGPSVYFGQSQAREPFGFQTIRLGDLKLVKEVRLLPESGIVSRQNRAVGGRRIYHAEIRHDPGIVTVAMYQGGGAEELWFPPYEIHQAWLAQANHIFAELEEEAHTEDYGCIYEIQFMLQIADKHHIPEGYLFISPPQDFCTGPHAHTYQWPACPAYWSLNPSGADRLSMEGAGILGFPAIHIETMVHGCTWDRSVYEGLRRFHKGKGFDPDSGEVARRLGYPLYEVLSDSSSEVPFPALNVSGWAWARECEQDDLALCLSLGHYL